MVRWYHATLSAYGFWLPNDPRGSWSSFVHSKPLYLTAGPATKVATQRSLAHEPHNTADRRIAKLALNFPPVRFNETQRRAIAVGIGKASVESKIRIHACAIGFDHIHVVVSKHTKSIEQIVGHFKGRATQAMIETACHPFSRYQRNGTIPSCWAQGCWSVFIEDRVHLHSAINYVNRHPEKEGLSAPNWTFIVPPIA